MIERGPPSFGATSLLRDIPKTGEDATHVMYRRRGDLVSLARCIYDLSPLSRLYQRGRKGMIRQ